MTSTKLFFNTLRFLKFNQIFYRVIYKLKIRGPVKLLSLEERVSTLSPSKFIVKNESLLSPKTFLFLNKKGRLDVIGWDGDQIEKLWRYNQHYFDYLNSQDLDYVFNWRDALLNDWLENCNHGECVGWEPYPTSLRIVNWIKWSLRGNRLTKSLLDSLATQAQWVSDRPEYHILGNHLFANAKALVFAGLYFKGRDADKWLIQGLKIIQVELDEQVLNDGGNFELSTMYHCIFLEDLLDLINFCSVYPHLIQKELIDTWRLKASSMLNWLDCMVHPDGAIGFFNDSATGIASTPLELFEYATSLDIQTSKSELKPGPIHLKDSGYVRVEAGKLVCLIDVAKVGPDYLPGHAHADTLSFECSLFGKRLFVNGGTSEYGSGQIRFRERGTANHNTVVVDQKNSSEVWSGFRVARRAYPFDLKINTTEDIIHVECSHNGYERLSKGLTHSRIWKASNSDLYILDTVKGCHSTAFAYYHLSPDIKILSHEASEIILLMENGKRVRLNYLGSSLEIIVGFYSPEFGKRIPNQCLKIGLDKLDGASLNVSWDS